MRLLNPIDFVEYCADRTMDFCGDDDFFYFGSMFFMIPIYLAYIVLWLAVCIPLAIIWVPFGLVWHSSSHLVDWMASRNRS